MAMQSAENEKDFVRPFPNFPPSVWGCTFASFPSADLSEFESYTKEMEVLKEKVKDMLMESAANLTQNIEFINLLCRLGVSYHFETEIDNHLNHILVSLQDFHQENNFTLNTLAVAFRVLRQHGYKMSCDVFKKFKNTDGEFKECITDDVKGLLSLYEATFLRFHGEDILDEALEFTKKHLEILAEKSSPNLAKHIKNALSVPFHLGVERIEALKYISFYQEDESRNETLLNFAKLDFNRLQLLYRKELALLSRWWKDLNLFEKLPYARDRIVEGYFWIHGSQMEPQCSFGRLMGGKYIQMVSLVDDTYDSYGTIDELKLFTSAFERCTIDAIHQLPNYMKVLYRSLLDLFGETENDQNEGICYRTSYVKDWFKELMRCSYIDAQWTYSEGYVPPFDEYVQNGLTTSTLRVLSAATMIGIEEIGITDYEWLKTNPKIIQAVHFYCRLMNDIKPHGHEVERKRGGCTLAVQSYMKEYGVSKEEAIERIEKLCADKWKDINEEYCKKPAAGSRIILKLYVNHARMTYLFYKCVDVYTYSSNLKDVIRSLFIDQIPL